VPNVSCYLTASYYAGVEHGEKDPTTFRYDHVAYFDVGVDIRDNYNVGLQQAGTTDSFYVPAGGGITATQFTVVFVSRHNRGTPADHKRAYCQRTGTPWPTNSL
jgi:hypothetical protein